MPLNRSGLQDRTSAPEGKRLKKPAHIMPQDAGMTRGVSLDLNAIKCSQPNINNEKNFPNASHFCENKLVIRLYCAILYGYYIIFDNFP
jgi:hypothetical protein